MSKLLQAMTEAKQVNGEFIIYFDIETLTYNKINAKNKPSEYKNVVYSVAIGVNINNEIHVETFPSFYHFFEKFFFYRNKKETFGKSKKVTMIAHNTNKYDSHFLLHDLVYFYNIERKNLYLRNASQNKNTVKKKDFKKNENVIFEKRVKSSINLDINFRLNETEFYVVDNYMKTHTSIKTLGENLLKLGVISEDKLKTDFNYSEFDKDEDMTESNAYAYAESVYKKLNKEQMTYIENDIYILGYSHIYFSDIFPGFDYGKITFTKNILDSYLNSSLTEFQLLNKFQEEKIKYTDFKFANQNLFDYIKAHYKGGLNFYNDEYVNTIINEKVFSMDLNSSYPYVMHNEKIPTFINDYDTFEISKEIDLDINNDNQFYLLRVDKNIFNIDVLSKIESKVIKQMIVKYYHLEGKEIAINSNTIRMINKICHLDIKTIYVNSYIKFDCVKFGGRDEIEKNYFIKSQGKQKNKIIMDSPYQYEITDEINTNVFSSEEISISKLKLNGIYGIPALRSHFNLFRISEQDSNELENIINGFANSERNLLFSTFVTSKAIYNLLEPLEYLTQKEIDENFIYADTDSLYLKQEIFTKIPKDLFDKIALGKWDIETFDLKKFFVLNHKKYAYQYQNGKISVKCGGVDNSAFNKNVDFDDFIKYQFCNSAKIKNTKSIYTKQKCIAIYESETEFKKGGKYPILFNPKLDKQIRELKENVRKEIDYTQVEDFLYIESELGSFSLSDVSPVINETEGKQEIKILKRMHNIIKKTLIK